MEKNAPGEPERYSLELNQVSRLTSEEKEFETINKNS